MDTEPACENPDCGICHSCRGPHLTKDCPEARTKELVEAARAVSKPQALWGGNLRPGHWDSYHYSVPKEDMERLRRALDEMRRSDKG